MRIKILSSASILFVGALFVTVKVAASGSSTPPPPLVIQPEVAPTSCVTKNGISVTGVTSGPPLNQFPVLLADPSSCGSATNPNPPGARCFQYQYTVSTPFPPLYYSLFSVSATQLVPFTSPVASLIQPAYTGDDDFLDDALHEYVLKFSGSTSTNVSLFVRTGPGESSNARVGTVMVKQGYKREGCLIATPGVTSGNAFQPISTSQQVTAAGGKCPVILVFDAGGNVVDVTLAPGAPSTCTVGTPPGGVVLVYDRSSLNQSRFKTTAVPTASRSEAARGPATARPGRASRSASAPPRTSVSCTTAPHRAGCDRPDPDCPGRGVQPPPGHRLLSIARALRASD